MTKDGLIERIKEQLQDEIAGLAEAARAAHDAATNEESKPENQYDTRALEASYLAAGQGERLASLRQLIGWFENLGGGPADGTVGLGSLVGLEDEDGDERWVLLAPQGGLKVPMETGLVQVVSPSAPLGAALVGLSEDEDLTLRVRGRARELVVVAVR